MRLRRLLHCLAPVYIVAIAGGCETKEKKAERLRAEADACAATMQQTQVKLDSAFGFWMETNPDTLLLIMAAYGDTLGVVKAQCDAAAQKYDKFMSRD